MSSHKSYFSKNNTIINGSTTNTGQNPVTELFFGNVDNIISPKGFSRFIFDLDLENLKSKVEDKTIILDSAFCPKDVKHILRMKNTSSFDKELLNDEWSNGRRRASSFTLNLYRIPYTGGDLSGSPQNWDEGVGYDYYQTNNRQGLNNQSYSPTVETDKSFSERPSNFFNSKTTTVWSTPGIYSNVLLDGAVIHENDLFLVDSQEFQFGDEDIEFDMTIEINNILNGSLISTGYIIAFPPQIENITGLTENYSVGFFTRHTQTFYEPYLETIYDDLIEDDRNLFVTNQDNKLYLYSFEGGVPINLDSLPLVDILDLNYDPVPNFQDLPTCQVTKGVYECEISFLTGDTIPCMFYDRWKNLRLNSQDIKDVENSLILQDYSNKFDIGINSFEPDTYSFNFYGIKQDEKILSTDIKKINVDVKKAYSTNSQLLNIDIRYRIYVKEGTTEVQVQDWTKVNKTVNDYSFVIDMNDKIPNEYFVDFKVYSNQETQTYKRELKFQVVNRK